LTIADRIKGGTAQALRQLRSSNIRKTVMLSGDRKSVVDAVAKELGIDEAHGELLPQDKVRIVEDHKSKGIPWLLWVMGSMMPLSLPWPMWEWPWGDWGLMLPSKQLMWSSKTTSLPSY